MILLLPISAQAALTDNLVSFWSLDDVTDSHGSNDLTNNNSVTFVTGKVGNAGNFNGSNQYLSITDGAQTGLDLTSSLTVNSWIYLDTAPSAGKADIINKVSFGDSQWLVAAQENSGDKGLLVLYENTQNNENFPVSISDWTASTWIMYTHTFNASTKEAEVFINGTSAGTVTNSNWTETRNGTATTFIGAYGVGFDAGYFDGKIDELGVWSRVLTDDEIVELYNSGSGLAYPFTGGGTTGGTTGGSTSTASTTDEDIAFGLSIIMTLLTAGLVSAFLGSRRL